jgi:hypothetical protein
MAKRREVGTDRRRQDYKSPLTSWAKKYSQAVDTSRRDTGRLQDEQNIGYNPTPF